MNLLPCPFCNGKALEYSHKKPCQDVHNSWIPGVAEAYIRCNKCWAQSQRVIVDCGHKDPTDGHIREALENARKLWNKRKYLL